MKIIQNNKLLSSLISSDIIYFSDNSTKIHSSYYSNKLKIKNKFILLNINIFLQNLKQFIRILQFSLKHYKNCIQIITSNKIFSQII